MENDGKRALIQTLTALNKDYAINRNRIDALEKLLGDRNSDASRKYWEILDSLEKQKLPGAVPSETIAQIEEWLKTL
jgi:hypothetical protein